MTKDELADTFERLNDEFIKFARITDPRHPRADICAFLMLHDLAPCACDEDYKASGAATMPDMVSDAEHDQIWLSADIDALAAVATEEIVADLLRCGVLYDSDNESLYMHV